MENGFKMRISRIFRSSLGSCRPKDITDVIQTSSPPIFLPDNHRRRHHHLHHQLMDLFSPKPPPPFSPLRRKPKCPQTQTCETRGYPLLLTEAEGQKCPPVTPISPFLDTFYDDHHHDRYFQNGAAIVSSSSKGKEKSKRTKKPRRVRSRIKTFGLHDEFPACSYNGLFSSDEDDDDKTTLFSSRSLSSDSSESVPRSRSCRMVERTNREKIRSGVNKVKDDSEIAAARGVSTEGKVKDSFAVVKRSSDPYNDFRTSMVEMIVERQIYSADELEELLQCFLSLNSYQHHGVIVKVFSEIWAALFSKSTHG